MVKYKLVTLKSRVQFSYSSPLINPNSGCQYQTERIEASLAMDNSVKIELGTGEVGVGVIFMVGVA